MNRPLLVFFLFLTFSMSEAERAFSQSRKYSRVKIYADGNGLAKLAEAGVCIDHGDVKHNVYFTSDFSATEINIVKQNGFKYDILIDDVQQFYIDQNDPVSPKYVAPPTPQSHGCMGATNYPTPANFAFGSMGGFFTYSEILGHMDNMALLFPNLVKTKAAISATNTHDGRPIYWMKISDNPNVDENESEMLYNAAHHAREPASVSQLIMYMYYLLENYNSKPEIKYLVDNLELYFVPMVNPDGYVYNQTTNPNGGGMWRKNRRDSQDGEYGVDLNRNYGYNWGYNSAGSSANTGSDTYRGPSAFSEPETQNIRTLCNAHQFKMVLNYHTYGNLLIYPWGYMASTYTPAPDSTAFVEYAKHLTHENHYTYGTGDQTVGYVSNGTSDDWMYGEQTSKPKIYAMTPECGAASNGFWPAQSKIIGICKENITQNLHAAHLLLKYALVKDDEPRYISATSGFINYTIRRLGMESPATFTVSIIPISANITGVGAAKTYSSLAAFQETKDSISFTLSGAAPGQPVEYILSVTNGLYTKTDTIEKIFGTPTIAFSSNANAMTGWSSSTGWGVSTSTFYSSTGSITDSPSGDYASNDSTRIRTASQVNLIGAISATLTYRARWEIEPRYDYAEVLVSTDNGNSYTALCGKYSKLGNAYQDDLQPVYDGFQFPWVREEIDLDAYINQNIRLRFMMRSDNYGDYDGFYFDDFKVEKLAGATAVHETSTGLSFSISPNPSSGEFKVQGLNFNVEKIVVTDVLGNLVKTTGITNQSSVVDLSGNPKGIYFIKAIDENGGYGVKKILIQ